MTLMFAGCRLRLCRRHRTTTFPTTGVVAWISTPAPPTTRPLPPRRRFPQRRRAQTQPCVYGQVPAVWVWANVGDNFYSRTAGKGDLPPIWLPTLTAITTSGARISLKPQHGTLLRQHDSRQPATGSHRGSSFLPERTSCFNAPTTTMPPVVYRAVSSACRTTLVRSRPSAFHHAATRTISGRARWVKPTGPWRLRSGHQGPSPRCKPNSNFPPAITRR